MAQPKDLIKASYPLPVYNYQVQIEGTTIGFSEVSGLNVDYQSVTYKHGLSFWMGEKIIPGMRQPVKLTLKKAVFLVKENDDDFLIKWFQKVIANPLENTKKDIVIDLCDELGKPVFRWKVQGAMPTKLDAPTFDSNSNAVAIETLELVAHNIDVDYHPQ